MSLHGDTTQNNIDKFHTYTKQQVNLKMAVFWNVILHSLVDIDWYFTDAFWLHHQGDV
jgi:hypothetical protein